MYKAGIGYQSEKGKKMKEVTREELSKRLNDVEVLLQDILFVEWHGRGENERNEFYCPWCQAHSEDSDNIPHEKHCGFYKIKEYFKEKACPLTNTSA